MTFKEQVTRQHEKYTRKPEVLELTKMVSDLNNNEYVSKQKIIEVLMRFLIENDQYITKLIHVSVVANASSVLSQKVMNIKEYQLKIVDEAINAFNRSFDEAN